MERPIDPTHPGSLHLLERSGATATEEARFPEALPPSDSERDELPPLDAHTRFLSRAALGLDG